MSEVPRQVLPIADRRHVGVATFDASDPDTSYPPIEPLRPPASSGRRAEPRWLRGHG
jgi:hypothetical protein